jgi:pimeloyl-ACP methyl ester carboxylesterase
LAELSLFSRPLGAAKRHVIFVHGLGGDLHRTWTSPLPPPPEERFWPNWLASDITDLAVWSIGYDAPVSEWRGSAMELTDRAGNVLSLLETDHQLAHGELIFIGHSLGGLVIKQFLRKASDGASRRAEAFSIIERTRKVAFLATPHQGADLTRWSERLRVILRPSAATRILVRNDQHLRDLNIWYRGWATEKRIAHLILYETKPTSMFGMVVKPDSSDPGLSAEPIAIDADHIEIAKPANPNCQIYKLVRSFIEREPARALTEIQEVRERQQSITKGIIMAGDRMATIGGDAVGNVIVAGDRNKIDAKTIARLSNVPSPPANSVDISKELSAIRGILEKLGGEAHGGKIGRALDDAAEEITKPIPDKDEIGSALGRALDYAKKSDDFADELEKLIPHLTNAVAWLGSSWHCLLSIAGLAL